MIATAPFGLTGHESTRTIGAASLGARWQDRLTPVQSRFADGCHLNRDTPTTIERAGFELVALERFELPPGHPLIKDAVQGVALKPA